MLSSVDGGFDRSWRGVFYSVGTGLHLWRTLPFHNAIWHSFVLFAASCHYAAVLHGVVLAGS